MSEDKKTKFVWNVVLKSYHSWNHRSGPDNIRITTYSYATQKLAVASLPDHMLESIFCLIINSDWETTNPSNPDFDDKHGKWWPTFVKRLKESNEDDVTAVAKQWFIEHNLVIKDIYTDLMKRCEYASNREDISIQKAPFVDE